LTFIGADLSSHGMLSAKHGGKGMAIIHDFVEDWIEMRSKLQRQLKLLESSKTDTGTDIIGSTTEATIIRLKKWIDELTDLLKEYAHADRT
jgi:hypothetical protein